MSEIEENNYDEGVRKLTNWLSKNLSGIFVVLISVFFIFQGAVEILPTTLGIKEQIITAITNIFAGFSITSLVGEYGFTSAKKSKEYNSIKNEYNSAVKDNLKYREAIDLFAKERAVENLKNTRIHILENVNIYYGDVFNSDGSLNMSFDITKYKKDKQYGRKYRAYRKAVSLRIVNINVFGLANSSSFGIKKETSEKEYRTKKGAKSLLFKFVLGTTSVGIMFVFNGWSWGAFIYAFMQIVLWVGFGLIDRQKNYNFVMSETIDQLESRTNYILEFAQKSDDEKQIYLNKAKELHKEIKQLTFNNSLLTNENK